MDLKNRQITLGELLEDSRSRAVLQQYFPRYLRNPLLLRMGRGHSLAALLELSRGRVPQEQVEQALTALENI